MSVVVLLGGFGLAFFLWLVAFGVSLCSLFGEQCSTSEEERIRLLLIASLGVFLVVPVAVAIVRREARWLLAPVIEAVLIAIVIAAVEWF